MSQSGLQVLSIYGTQDKVLKEDSYKKDRSNLPDSFIELIIEGGNHAYFGNYGEQKGDGSPLINQNEQMMQTVNAVVAMISGN